MAGIFAKPFLRLFAPEKDMVRELCLTAASLSVVRDDDEVFGPNEVADYAILLVNGKMEYEPIRSVVVSTKRGHQYCPRTPRVAGHARTDMRCL
eukprot:629779-Amphidinium_carterae.1